MSAGERIDVEDLIDRYLRTDHIAERLFQRDAVYHMQVKWFRRALSEFDAALSDERVSHSVRRRILEVVLKRSIEGTVDAAYRAQVAEAYLGTPAIHHTAPQHGGLVLD